MAKETLGYVRLEWTCPNCNTRNPGPQKTCTSCGAPQPEDVEFEQPAQEELITDEAEVVRARLGPDVHCYYCGTRNPADAETCSQCGADLTQATARSSGRVVGGHRTGPAEKVECPACGTPNEANAPKCVQCGASLPRARAAAAPAAKSRPKGGSSRLAVVIGVIVLLTLCAGAIALAILSRRTQDLTGAVQQVAWTRTITVEGLVPVEYEDWREEISGEALIGACIQKIHHTQDEPADNAKKVCGTPYTEDSGSGYGEVVQDCEYQVYADWCDYTVEEWQEVDETKLTGRDLNVAWPVLNLGGQQREGPRDETYEILFSVDGETYTYHTDDPAEFARYQAGSRWLLKINTFGNVIDAEPLE